MKEPLQIFCAGILLGAGGTIGVLLTAAVFNLIVGGSV